MHYRLLFIRCLGIVGIAIEAVILLYGGAFVEHPFPSSNPAGCPYACLVYPCLH